MDDGDGSGAGEGNGLDARAAYAALGNETRLTIVRTLWEHWTEGPVPFSELRRDVGMRDAGQFHYHLRQLRGHFVRSSDDGYELTPAGFKIAQSVVAGTGIDEPGFDAAVLAADCPRCGSPVELRYADGMIRLYCTDCAGFWRGADEYGSVEPGYLFGWEFPPAGLEGRDPDEILAAAVVHLFVRTRSLAAGACPDCGGRATGSLSVCGEHDPGDGVCDACGRYFLGAVGWRCATCKLLFGAPSWAVAAVNPAVRTARSDEGVGYHDEPWRLLNVGYREGWEEAVVDDDPPRLRLSIPTDGDDRELLLDENGRVVEGVE